MCGSRYPPISYVPKSRVYVKFEIYTSELHLNYVFFVNSIMGLKGVGVGYGMKDIILSQELGHLNCGFSFSLRPFTPPHG